MTKFYITTAIPYVNASPHIGHALEFVQADVIARFHRLKGEEVILLSGSDENALKNVQAAEKAGIPVQKFIDDNANLFVDLVDKLGIKLEVFQKGSNKDHYSSSQKLWELCNKAGDIYKKSYEGLYCVGCETFYTKDELDSKEECFEHPGKKLEKIAEENYFFKLSRYQEQIVSLLEKDELSIIPLSRKNEIVSFLKNPLQDISISRSSERAKNWGVPVPGDDSQRMYVWFDALNIYQSGIGFGIDEKQYKKWWPADVHVIGKGITRFHAIYWPAFLLSAGLPLPKSIFVHGYITVGGQKMSKTLGNVVDPFDLIERYGFDAVRYFLLREISPTEDGDFTEEKFKARYNSDLAGGLGNLVARTLKMAEGESISPESDEKFRECVESAKRNTEASLVNFAFNEALVSIWSVVHFCDEYIDKERPWEKKEGYQKALANLVFALEEIGNLLEPFLPETTQRIRKALENQKSQVLFPRK